MNIVRRFFFGLVLLVMAVTAAGCGFWNSEDTATKALETLGFTDIKIESHKWILVKYRGCSDSDYSRFDATAKNSLGKIVSVQVCVGMTKGATVRGD